MGFHLLSTGRAQLSEEEKAPSPDPNLSRFSKGSVLHAPPNELVPLPESALNFFFGVSRYRTVNRRVGLCAFNNTYGTDARGVARRENLQREVRTRGVDV